MTASRLLILAVTLAAVTGCEAAKRVAIAPFYRTSALAGGARFIGDVPYVEGPGAHPIKHRLDLFIPAAPNFATVIFVHGGNWVEGDKSLHVAGADIYRNIGRFLASHGYGAAIVNYRLIPEVSWEQQPADIARAVAWVRGTIASYGGNAQSIVLMGHSAGAQLASLVAVDPRWLREAGVPEGSIRGVIAVSGAGYDISDEETYRLFGHSREWYARRFHTDESPEWAHDASPVNFLDRSDPPFLLMYSLGDKRGVVRQTSVMRAALEKAGIWTWTAPISGLNHSGMVIVMSRPDRSPGQVVLRYLSMFGG